MQTNLDVTVNKKTVAHGSDNPNLENTLNAYIRARISLLMGESLFREEEIRRIALEQVAVSDNLPAKQGVIKARLESKFFKTSKHLFYNLKSECVLQL